MPPSRATFAGVQLSIGCWPPSPRPNTAMNTTSPAMPTTLLTTGAHMYAPNRPRALSTWPSTV